MSVQDDLLLIEDKNHCINNKSFLSFSFSTDDENDTEVEAVDLDTELNLVTECWVEPQSGTVTNCMDQHRYFQGLKYQEIPQAVCISITYSSTSTMSLLSLETICMLGM